MKRFTFNKEISKIIDFYRLPDFGPMPDFKKDGVYKRLKKNKYIAMIDKFYKSHKAFEEKNVEMIYGGLRPFSIFNLLSYEEFIALKTIENVRLKLLKKSEDELRISIVRSLIKEDDDPNQYISDASKLFSLIDSSLEDDFIKWKFTKAINKPIDSLREYLDYLFIFKKDFEKIYGKEEKQLCKKAREYEKLLNAEGLSALNKMAGGRFESAFKHLEKCDDITFAVSMFAPIGLGFDTESNALIIGIRFDVFMDIQSEIDEEYTNSKVRMFKNLGDNTRFKIFMAIGRGIATNTELAKECGVSKPTVSYHLNNMMFDEMVIISEDLKYYEVNKEKVIESLKSFIKEVEEMK